MKRQTYTRTRLGTRVVAMFMVVGLLIALLGAGIVAAQNTTASNDIHYGTNIEDRLQ